eukprot:4503691-Lingulodinium_polyedra.AAC.1
MARGQGRRGFLAGPGGSSGLGGDGDLGDYIDTVLGPRELIGIYCDSNKSFSSRRDELQAMLGAASVPARGRTWSQRNARRGHHGWRWLAVLTYVPLATVASLPSRIGLWRL